MEEQFDKLIEELTIELNENCNYREKAKWDSTDFEISESTIYYSRSQCGSNNSGSWDYGNICNECNRIIERHQGYINNLDSRFFSHQFILNEIASLNRKILELEERINQSEKN